MLEQVQNSVLATKRPGIFGGSGSWLANYAQQPEFKEKRFNLTVFTGKVMASPHHGGFSLEPKLTSFSTFEQADNLARRGFSHASPSGAAAVNRDAPIYITLPNFFKEIYGHWMTDILPDYMVAKGLLPDYDVKLLHSGPIPKYGYGLSSSFGLSSDIFVDVSSIPADAECQIISMSATREHDFFHADLVKRYCTKPMQNHLGTDQQVLGDARVFISRRKWREIGFNTRSLLNYAEVEGVFEKSGYEIVFPETLTIEEQVNLFKSARIIAGESGSGLHNNVFMPRGGHVICLQSGRQTQLIQSALGLIVDQTCDYVIGQQENEDWSSNYVIKPEDAQAAIDAGSSLT